VSLVLAADYRVKDFDHWWSLIGATVDGLHRLRAHHLVVYRALEEGDRVFVTVGVHERGPLEALLRSPLMLRWFDTAGVEDIPSIFAGHVLEKLDLAENTGERGSVIVAGIVSLDDVERWQASLHGSLDGLRAHGVRRLWTYQAFDDENEVMILQEIDTERHARRWITDPTDAAEWMARAGVGAYPPLFVGRIAHVTALESDPSDV
jgi:hypothetical protein